MILNLAVLAENIPFSQDIVIDTTTPGVVFQSDPNIDVDNNGNICIVWAESLTPYNVWPTRYYITSILSSDGGNTFHSKAFVDTSEMPYPYPGMYNSKDHVSVKFDVNGNPLVAWREYYDYTFDGIVFITKSLNQGLSYLPRYYYYECRDGNYSYVFDDNNTLYMAWLDGWFGELKFAKSSDGGLTFDSVKTVVDFSSIGVSIAISPIYLLLDSSSNIYIFWNSEGPKRRIWLSRSFDSGETFLAPDTIINFSYQQAGHYVIIIEDEFYLVFRGFISPVNDSLYFSHSYNNGQSFTEPRAISKVNQYKLYYNQSTGLLFRLGDKIIRSIDFGLSYPDTGLIQPDSGYQASIYDFTSDNSGNVYVVGARSKIGTIGEGHVFLKKADFYTNIKNSQFNSKLNNFELKQNYPNPFNPETAIKFILPKQTKTELIIYNILGQVVKFYNFGTLGEGNHKFIWNGEDQNGIPISSGVYIYELRTSDSHIIKKMLLIR